jgi:hypothetical protein
MKSEADHPLYLGTFVHLTRSYFQSENTYNLEIKVITCNVLPPLQ